MKFVFGSTNLTPKLPLWYINKARDEPVTKGNKFGTLGASSASVNLQAAALPSIMSWQGEI